MESAELIAILREVREKVRASHPEGAAPGGVPLPDLTPLLQARDAALGKVASIGTVNPRPGGPLNALVQAWKRLVARVLDWHVRDQVVFNRKVVECVDATLEALNDSQRAVGVLAGRVAAVQEQAVVLRTGQEQLGAAQQRLAQDLGQAHQRLAVEFDDIRKHWSEWRQGWEHKLSVNEIQFLRSVADLQGAFQHRVTLMDTSYRESVRTQHAEFTQALEKAAATMRLDFDRLVHSELRLLRQRLEVHPVEPARAAQPAAGQPAPLPAFDYGRFAERFRGAEEYVEAGQKIYLPYFAGRKNVLDIGCGRGEFLTMMRAAGVPARGIDLGPESVALCRQKGLDAETADLYEYLAGRPEQSFDGIFCSQVVEHLPPERLPEMIRLAASRLAPGGVIALETPNPECLAIFATHFYLDPTHTRPIPHPLLMFYLEEFGVGGIEVKKLSAAVETMPSLAALPAEFREAFFGGLDYAVIGTKLL